MVPVDFFSFTSSYPSRMPETLRYKMTDMSFIKLVCLLWIIFLQVAVETFENAVVDIREEAWLQGQVDLLLHSRDSTVLRLAQLPQLG